MTGSLHSPTRIALSFLALALWAPFACSEVNVELTAFRIISETGDKVRYTSAEQIAPGDLLEYWVVYTNTGERAVNNLRAQLPIPDGLVYVQESARPTDVLASRDGQSFAETPLLRWTTDASGQRTREPVPLGEYRMLRWVKPTLQAGDRFVVRARAQVLN